MLPLPPPPQPNSGRLFVAPPTGGGCDSDAPRESGSRYRKASKKPLSREACFFASTALAAGTFFFFAIADLAFTLRPPAIATLVELMLVFLLLVLVLVLVLVLLLVLLLLLFLLVAGEPLLRDSGLEGYRGIVSLPVPLDAHSAATEEFSWVPLLGAISAAEPQGRGGRRQNSAEASCCSTSLCGASFSLPTRSRAPKSGRVVEYDNDASEDGKEEVFGA